MGTDLDDIRWIAKILKGETEYFARLVDKYKDNVFSLASGILKTKEEAEEAAQDVFVKVFKALPRFRHQAKFSTWVYRIAYNECISRIRRQKTITGSMEQISPRYLGHPGDDREEVAEREKQFELLHKVISRLSEKDRALVHFFYFDNLPVQEIAKITGLSVSNVKTKLFRIRNKMREEMQQEIYTETWKM